MCAVRPFSPSVSGPVVGGGRGAFSEFFEYSSVHGVGFPRQRRRGHSGALLLVLRCSLNLPCYRSVMGTRCLGRGRTLSTQTQMHVRQLPALAIHIPGSGFHPFLKSPLGRKFYGVDRFLLISLFKPSAFNSCLPIVFEFIRQSRK